MTTLVIGGAGFIGSALVRELALLGEPVRATCRRGEPRDPDLATLPVQWVAADLLDPPSLRYALEGCDSIYYCAGFTSTRRSDAKQVFEINHQGLLNFLAVARAAQVDRIVYVGSVFGLGVSAKDQPPADERVSYNLEQLHAPFFRAQREAELAVQNAIEMGLYAVCVYPGFCIGPGDQRRSSSRHLIAYLRWRLPITIPGGICHIDVRDAAHGLVLAMQHGRSGERYLIPGHNVTYYELFTQLAHAAHRRPPVMQIPVMPVRLAARVAEGASLHPLIDSPIAEILPYTWWYDDTKMRNELGLVYRPLESSLQDTLAWLKAQRKKQ
jgi:dihydroflavonol-4-reductase